MSGGSSRRLLVMQQDSARLRKANILVEKEGQSLSVADYSTLEKAGMRASDLVLEVAHLTAQKLECCEEKEELLRKYNKAVEDLEYFQGANNSKTQTAGYA